MLAVALFFFLLFLYWGAQINAEEVLNENEILISRKIVYAKVLLSSYMLAYEDENGVHAGMLDENKIKNLDEDRLFETYSYQADDIEVNAPGGGRFIPKSYAHLVRIEVLEPKTEILKEVKQVRYGVGFANPIEFPLTIRDEQGNVKLGRILVNIVPVER